MNALTPHFVFKSFLRIFAADFIIVGPNSMLFVLPYGEHTGV